MWGTEQFWGIIDSHSIFFSYYGSQWCPKTAWLQTFFKISSFVFSRTKTFIQVWNYLRVSYWWQNFHFGWTVPLIIVIQVYNTHISIDYIYYTMWALNMYCICILRLKVMTIFIYFMWSMWPCCQWSPLQPVFCLGSREQWTLCTRDPVNRNTPNDSVCVCSGIHYVTGNTFPHKNSTTSTFWPHGACFGPHEKTSLSII